MTCPHSPYAADEGEPTAPQDGQLHTNIKRWRCTGICIHTSTHVFQLYIYTQPHTVPHPLSPCVGCGQVPTPEDVSPPASTGGAAQTKSQAGVTGNACYLVGEGGESNPTRSHTIICHHTLICTKPSSFLRWNDRVYLQGPPHSNPVALRPLCLD